MHRRFPHSTRHQTQTAVRLCAAAEVGSAGRTDEAPVRLLRRQDQPDDAGGAAIGVGIVLLGNSWLQLLLAALLGLVFAHFGFLGHDAAHRQIFVSGKANHRAGLVLGTLFSGMSLVWWNSKHNKHHQAPNQISKDPDIEPSVLHFYPVEPKPERSRLLALPAGAAGLVVLPAAHPGRGQPARPVVHHQLRPAVGQAAAGRDVAAARCAGRPT